MESPLKLMLAGRKVGFRKSDEPLCTKARGESVTFGTQIEPRTATGVGF